MRTLDFETLIKLHNTAFLVSNPHWRETYHIELVLVWGEVHGYTEGLTRKGWQVVVAFYDDIMDASPLTLSNPGNLPVL